MFDKIVFLIGANHMSVARQDWIRAFLSLFQPVANYDFGSTPAWATIDVSVDLPAICKGLGTLLVGHEISKDQAAYLDKAGASFLDIRVSPIRFMAHDNVFAVGTNCLALKTILAGFSLSRSDIAVEASAFMLSLRYRDLGQGQFPSGSLVFFTEQPTGPDSIHHGDEAPLHRYMRALETLTQRYPDRYLIARPNDPPADIALLESMGFHPVTANIYAVLGSKRVASIAAVRSGIISEAQYFDKKIYALDQPTTLLWDGYADYDDSRPWFFNITPDYALSSRFWKNLLSGAQLIQPEQVAVRRPQDMIRRALNNWNSSAAGLHLRTQLWNETIGDHIVSLRHFLQQEFQFRFDNRLNMTSCACTSLTGLWRWFSGELVYIETDGHVRSDSDFGMLTSNADGWSIHWIRRELTDLLSIMDGDDRLSIKNQYGDGGEAVRLNRS